MAWFKKKEEVSLPELPESGELPKLPEFSPTGRLPGLEIDNFPAVPELGQKEIKHELGKEDGEMQKSGFTPLPNAGVIAPVGKPEPIIAEPSMVLEDLPKTVELPLGAPISRTKKAEPVYVRLDKFKASLESFEEIKNKVVEIEELLGKIRETKDKEEMELEEWEREIQIVKSRIEAIDGSIFGKLD